MFCIKVLMHFVVSHTSNVNMSNVFSFSVVMILALLLGIIFSGFMDVDDVDEKSSEYVCVHEDCYWDEIEQRRCSLTPESGEQLKRALILDSNVVNWYSVPNLDIISANANYTQICELIWDEEISNTFIEWIIIHAEFHNDTIELEWMKSRGFGPNPKGRALLKGYKSILNVIGYAHKNVTDVHMMQAFIGSNELSEIMSRRHFQFLQRHYRYSDCSDLPDKTDPNYHVFQNINHGCELLRKKSIRLFYLGRFTIYDEGRVTQTSKRAAGTTRNVTKPIKYGNDINWLCGIMKETQGVVWNHIIPVSDSVSNSNEKTTVNLLRQLTIDDPEIDGSGRYIMGDNKFADVEFAEELFAHDIGCVFACSLGKTKHLSAQHQKAKKDITNTWQRGESELWENDHFVNVELSLWNDSNSASFIGTGIKSWIGSCYRQIGKDKVMVNCPMQSIIYNSAYHAVDTNNQYQAKCPLDYKTCRKQQRMGLQTENAYLYENGFHFFKNLNHIPSSLARITYRGCKSELALNWKHDCIAEWGRNVPYLCKQLSKQQRLLYTYETDTEHDAIHINPLKKKKKLRCSMCGRPSCWKCSACSNRLKINDIVVLCGPNHPDRKCWYEW
eukprot:134001_1